MFDKNSLLERSDHYEKTHNHLPPANRCSTGCSWVCFINRAVARYIAGAPDPDWIFSAREAHTPDSYCHVCDTYTYFDSGIACDLPAVTFGVDAIISSTADPIYNALLYIGEWSAEDVYTIW